MNYRHGFHAGNFADVMKHAILARLVTYLKGKTAAFRVIDTHAGRGRYDLLSREGERSPEWRDGIARLLTADLPPAVDDLLAPYLDVVRGENPNGGVTVYPGSPLLVRRLLRSQDRLSALDLHPEEYSELAVLFAGDIQTRATLLDGWLALPAFLPPKEKRGLVLVDPPFELPGEFERLAMGLAKAHRRFSAGLFALWYPIKDPTEIDDFIHALEATAIPRMLRVELTIRPPSTPPRLHGSGLILVNPPFTLEAELQLMLPALAEVLSDAGRGSYLLDWIRRED
ncbi:MAG: rRNA ((2030)-N(6))-methyltransferase RlmJ [Devosia sp.]|nr:rRNA ((2030)-N(6))-methyltransferase RlmJ [Devosia sp.]